MRNLLLGCIADDFTGATDLANNLVRAGMRVVQTIGIPRDAAPIDADAVVVALKSRTIPAGVAASQAVAASRWLRSAGAQQIYFKVCSTFDSTPRGNIGPVMDALMDELGCAFSIVTPAFPDNERTVFKGHLFVGDVLLSDSGMRDHPLTPMTDANLVRVLQAQMDIARSDGGRRVGLVDYRCVGDGRAAIVARMAGLQAQGCALAIADAVSNQDLIELGAAVEHLPLVCAGSGLAIGLPANWGISPSAESARLPAAHGRKAVVSGSCSSATRAQVSEFIQSGGAACALDPLALAAGGDALEALVAERVAWAERAWHARPGQPVLIYSTAAPEDVRAAQRHLGVAQAGALVERALALVARRLVEAGVRQLVVAGGETAGACVGALEITRLRIGGQIDPGVPWCHAVSGIAQGEGMHIALKSGNFGGAGFFIDAFEKIA